MSRFNPWLSDKGIKYILSPKRAGSWTIVNPDVSPTVMAGGMQRWIGAMISPDVQRVFRNGNITTILCNDGSVIYYNGECFYED